MKKRTQGFTLIEVMIVVVIIAILAAVAMPSYQESVRKGRRAMGKTVLQEQAQFMERYYTQNGRYTQNAAGTTMVTLNPSSDATAIYTFQFDTTETDAQKFRLQAVPVTGGPQAGDRCGTLTLTNTGIRGIENQASGVTVVDCW